MQTFKNPKEYRKYYSDQNETIPYSNLRKLNYLSIFHRAMVADPDGLYS